MQRDKGKLMSQLIYWKKRESFLGSYSTENIKNVTLVQREISIRR